jgi:hypothetical protein
MSKLLSEGVFDKILSFIVAGKVNKGIKLLQRDPEVKAATEKLKQSTAELKSALTNYEKKYGKNDFVKKAEKFL